MTPTRALPAATLARLRCARSATLEVARHRAARRESPEPLVLREIEAGKPVPGTYPPNAAARARYAKWRARWGRR
jgi:hypothetical protein